MQTIKKIESYFSRIESIRYENEHGGAYAYVQFLAYSRELMRLLRPFKRLEKEMETIESITWLFNEYLAAKFTPRQKSIFEEKMMETRELFQVIRSSLKKFEREYPISSSRILHKQAA
jgi:hypothetical protein